MSAPERPGSKPGVEGSRSGEHDTGLRWSFLKQAIENLQRQESRVPHRWLKPISDWAARQEQSGLLRIWSSAARPREAGDVWVLEDRDVRLDPFFLTSVVLHLLFALFLWRVIAELPELEPPKKEVVVRLEEFLPKVDAGGPAAKPAPKPEPPKAAAQPKEVKKAVAAKPRAPKPKPKPVVQKPVPKPAPKPRLVPKQIQPARSISRDAPVSPKTPTATERIARLQATESAAEVALGAGTSAAEIDVDRGGGTGVRGPVGPVAVPGGRGPGTGLSTGAGRGNTPGNPLLGFETDPDFTEYFEKIRRRILKVWRYPPGVSGRHQVVLRFKLDAGARAFDITVKRSSNAVLNDGAMEAMRRGSPFPPIPDKFHALIGRPIAITLNVTITESGR
jgi:TonB family protein